MDGRRGAHPNIRPVVLRKAQKCLLSKLEYRVASQAKSPWRVVLFRAFAAVLVILAVGLPVAASAQSITNLRKYAGIVVDAKSGKVL